jgi:hypothetical protein
MNDGPKLLVEWSPRWHEFQTAIGPALGRSPSPLAGEAPTGLFPLRGILVSWGAEAIFLAMLIILPAKLALLQPNRLTTPPKHEVIYYYGDELPQVQDAAGAEAGRSGRAGGKQTFNKSQTIRVARGNRATDKVVEAPNLKLPVSTAPVANLIAVKPIPGPPPSEGLRSSNTPPVLSKGAIVAPPPEVMRELDRATPRLNSSVIPPPANASADRRRDVMGLSTAVVAPAPTDIPHDKGRAVIAMTSPIIQPSPDDVQRDPPPLRGPTAATNIVVPPPVSAPVRESATASKMTLPAPAVIAPPPSQVTTDRTVSGVSIADPKVVPPPVQLGGRTQDKRAIIGVTGANAIVPPPPSFAGGTTMDGGGRGHGQKAGGFGTVLSADNVVPPPPSMSGTAGTGRAANPTGRLGGGSAGVVPPPPNLSTTGTGLSGHGTGTKGGGFGGPGDAGSVLAPPSPGGGNGAGKGLIVSGQPGSTLGVPGNGSAGSLAMSPSGGDKPGLGGSGGGSGIGTGNGPGSGLSGEGTGGAKAGTGHGSDPNSRGGISPYPGTGGAGSGTTGQPPAPGVSISGGNTAAIINLPSFGSNDSDPNVPGRTPNGRARRNLDVTVEGTSRSGGAFNFYGLLRGDKVYTKYLPTGSGTVVMQFADPLSANRPYSQDLTSPDALVTNLTIALHGSRIVIRCQLDRYGALRDFQKIDADVGAPTAKVVAALHAWKFTPAYRGNDPVEVSVLLGFNIDTR